MFKLTNEAMKALEEAEKVIAQMKAATATMVTDWYAEIWYTESKMTKDEAIFAYYLKFERMLDSIANMSNKAIAIMTAVNKWRESANGDEFAECFDDDWYNSFNELEAMVDAVGDTYYKCKEMLNEAYDDAVNNCAK